MQGEGVSGAGEPEIDRLGILESRLGACYFDFCVSDTLYMRRRGDCLEERIGQRTASRQGQEGGARGRAIKRFLLL